MNIIKSSARHFKNIACERKRNKSFIIIFKNVRKRQTSYTVGIKRIICNKIPLAGKLPFTCNITDFIVFRKLISFVYKSVVGCHNKVKCVCACRQPAYKRIDFIDSLFASGKHLIFGTLTVASGVNLIVIYVNYILSCKYFTQFTYTHRFNIIILYTSAF